MCDQVVELVTLAWVPPEERHYLVEERGLLVGVGEEVSLVATQRYQSLNTREHNAQHTWYPYGSCCGGGPGLSYDCLPEAGWIGGSA